MQENVQRLKQAQILRSLAKRSDFTIAAREVVSPVRKRKFSPYVLSREACNSLLFPCKRLFVGRMPRSV